MIDKIDYCKKSTIYALWVAQLMASISWTVYLCTAIQAFCVFNITFC